MKPTNRDKKSVIDESVLDETPPNINEPQTDPEDKPEDVNQDNEETPPVIPTETPEIKVEPEVPVVTPEETQEQKDQRYKAQQTEAQIQAAKNRSLISKVDEANKVSEPTIDELRAYVSQDGVNWDELTTFEQSMAKRNYIAEKRFSLINDAVQSTKKIDEWATKVDTFIDSTDGKPEYVPLSGHEADFRKFCMTESHRGVDIEILLPAFLHNLPKVEKKRTSIFETGGGGERPPEPGVLDDTDTVANLRTSNPREYKRLVRSGKIKLDV
jgi:hypothetical protein